MPNFVFSADPDAVIDIIHRADAELVRQERLFAQKERAERQSAQGSDTALRVKGSTAKASAYDGPVPSDTPPSVFISYSHADNEVAHAFAQGLEANDLRVWIDDNELLAGDSIIEQISQAVAGVDFFCALVSPASRESNWCRKELSLAVTGMLGREGATVIPLRVGDVEMPESLQDVLYVDLDPNHINAAVERITRDVRRHRVRRERDGTIAVTQEEQTTATPPPAWSESLDPDSYVPVRIVGIVKEGVSKPRDDGTRGSALYSIPLRLSRRPSEMWSRHFRETWDSPPQFTTMHRPGIASVQGDTIVLDGTTMSELEQYHAETLRAVLDKVNEDVRSGAEQERAERRRKQESEARHEREVNDVASRLRFD
jgi:predicted nucleotide-binding protein